MLKKLFKIKGTMSHFQKTEYTIITGFEQNQGHVILQGHFNADLSLEMA